MPPALLAPRSSDLLSQLKIQKQLLLTGLPGGSKGFLIASLAAQRKTSMLVITNEDLEAEGLLADCEAWGGLQPADQRPVFLLFPEQDPAARIASLGIWAQQARAVLVCSKTAMSL